MVHGFGIESVIQARMLISIVVGEAWQFFQWCNWGQTWPCPVCQSPSFNHSVSVNRQEKTIHDKKSRKVGSVRAFPLHLLSVMDFSTPNSLSLSLSVSPSLSLALTLVWHLLWIETVTLQSLLGPLVTDVLSEVLRQFPPPLGEFRSAVQRDRDRKSVLFLLNTPADL